MGMDQQLLARFYVKDKASKSYLNNGSPVDIPLSAEPYCGIRHFEDVTYVMKEVLYWRRNEGVHEFIRAHVDGCMPNDCMADIYLDKAVVMDLRDELTKLANGEKSELTAVFDSYMDDEGNVDKEWARQDAATLNRYLHMGEHMEFVYSYSY